MSFDYLSIVQEAQEAIEEYGTKVKVITLNNKPDATDKPWHGGSGKNGFDVMAAFVPASGFGGKIINEELLKRVNTVCLIADLRDLSKIDFIDDDGLRLKVDWIEFIKPSTIACLYMFGLNR